MTFSHIITLDIGSSSVRAGVITGEPPALLAHTSTAHRFHTDADGASEADADALRLALEACIDRVLAQSPSARIDRVGMATFAGNLLGIDKEGRAVTPIYTYADTRAADDLISLRANIDAKAAYQRTGAPTHTAYHPARLRWLHRTGRAANVTRWGDVGAYCLSRWLAGAPFAASISIAAWSGMLDRAALDWDADWVNVIGIARERLAPIVRDGDSRPLVGLTPEYAARWPQLKEAEWFLPIGDGTAANLGVGAVGAGRVALTVGTTTALRMLIPRDPNTNPPPPPGLWRYAQTPAWDLVGGALTEGGSTFDWARRALSLPDRDAIEGELAARDADQHGLTVLPMLGGERAPGWHPDAVGTFHGVRLGTTPIDLLHAALESVALRVAQIADRLIGTENEVEILAGGGALTASPAWAGMFADALGRPVTVIDAPETTLIGAARWAAGAGRDPRLMVPIDPRDGVLYKPRTDRTAIYAAARARQEGLYARLYR